MVADIPDYASVSRVLRSVLAELPEPRSEVVRSAHAFGRVSAETVGAVKDMPQHDTSHMDGLAVRSSDLDVSTGAELLIVGTSGPGQRTARRLRNGEAVRVATGSYLPPGADSVIPVEQVKARGSTARVNVTVRRGQFVFHRGEDIRRGEAILRRGSRIRAQDVGQLLAAGIENVRVFASPKVALLATGSELTDSASKGLVRNSHIPIVQKMMEALGCQTIYLGIVPDDRRKILAKIQEGLGYADAVVTTGGTSVGRFDLAGDVVASLKPSVLFHGIRMDRGRVAGVGVVEAKPLLMLPGPVQGAVNALVLLGIPILGRMMGCSRSLLEVDASLSSGWEARKRFPHFTKVVYVKLTRRKGGLLATPLAAETESMSLLTRADGFVIVPERMSTMSKGEMVRVLMVPGFSYF